MKTYHSGNAVAGIPCREIKLATVTATEVTEGEGEEAVKKTVKTTAYKTAHRFRANSRSIRALRRKGVEFALA